MYAADLKYVTGTDQLHITIFKKLVINENVKPKYPKLDLVTTRFCELHDLVNKFQLPSYFIIYHYSI